MKCTNCNVGNYEKRKVPYVFLGVDLGVFEALVCDYCCETLFESESSAKIETELKKRGLWGLHVRDNWDKVLYDRKILKSLLTREDFTSIKKGFRKGFQMKEK